MWSDVELSIDLRERVPSAPPKGRLILDPSELNTECHLCSELGEELDHMEQDPSFIAFLDTFRKFYMGYIIAVLLAWQEKRTRERVAEDGILKVRLTLTSAPE